MTQLQTFQAILRGYSKGKHKRTVEASLRTNGNHMEPNAIKQHEVAKATKRPVLHKFGPLLHLTGAFSNSHLFAHDIQHVLHVNYTMVYDNHIPGPSNSA